MTQPPVVQRRQNYERAILDNSIFYSFSTYIRLFAKLLSGVFIAKLLGPATYGLKNAFDLVLSYEAYSDLGTFSALNRQVPYFRGERDNEKVATALDTVFSVNLLYATVASAALVSAAGYVRHLGYESRYVDFLFYLGLIVFTTKLRTYFQTKLKTEMRFFLLSRVEILYGLSLACLGILGSYLYGFRGLLASVLLADLICLAYMLPKERQLPRLRVSLAMYGQLLKIGIPITILFFLTMLLSTANRTLIIAMISEEALGYFGIAMVAVSIIALVPNTIHNVTLVPIMEKLGATRERRRIMHFFIDPTVLIAYALPLLIASLYFFIHLPIVHYLDKFTPAVKVVKILSAGYFFNAAATPALSVSLAVNKQVRLIVLVAPIVLINVCLNLAFIKMGWGIEGAAFATGLSYVIYFLVIVSYASRLFESSLRELTALIAMITAPFLYAAGLALLIERFIPPHTEGLLQDIGCTVLKFAMFTALYSAVFLKIRRHPAFVKLADNIWFRRRK